MVVFDTRDLSERLAEVEVSWGEAQLLETISSPRLHSTRSFSRASSCPFPQGLVKLPLSSPLATQLPKPLERPPASIPEAGSPPCATGEPLQPPC